MFSFIIASGWPMWLLLLCSVLGLSFAIDRFLFLRQNKIVPDYLPGQTLNEFRLNGSFSSDSIKSLSENSPLGRLLAIVVLHHHDVPQKVRELIAVESLKIERQMSRFLVGLGTIASIGPLIGLLGTVIGMIHIFAAHGADGSSDPLQLAHGISMALYNTGMGLVIAIPALILYRHFRAVVDEYLTDMEHITLNFLYDLQSSEVAE